uniref:Uncharacterized protein n=1 Tax=Aegilops tauschii subsp. strangulata TaxID=200361 RepID=A0A453I210_AEGTS
EQPVFSPTHVPLARTRNSRSRSIPTTRFPYSPCPVYSISSLRTSCHRRSTSPKARFLSLHPSSPRRPHNRPPRSPDLLHLSSPCQIVVYEVWMDSIAALLDLCLSLFDG